MSQPSARFRALIADRRARVGIVGLGYVGLPLARAFTGAGFQVLGFDTDESKVSQLARGESYLRHLPSGDVQRMRRQGFQPTHDLDRLDLPDVLLLCVPTPLTPTREPDLGFVVRSSQAIASRLQKGQLVVLESTTYPGTTREVVLPILEESGLRAGEDFFLAYSPEREDPGNADFSLGNIPKVVGGLDPLSLEMASTLYREVAGGVVPVSSLEVAEACKILENTYRAVNIALVNELKVLYGHMGIDIWEVIGAAATKPFGFQPFYPGPGLGGHCIPVDPFYLAWAARKHGLTTRFIELAGEVNTAMPAYVLGRLADALNDRGKPMRGSRVLLLGMAYKRDVDDCRESPGLALRSLLLQKGVLVSYNDPYVPHLPCAPGHACPVTVSQPLTADSLAAQDAVIIVTDHSAYDWEWIAGHASLLLDTRNATRGVTVPRDNIVRA